MLIIDRFEGNYAVVEDSESDTVKNIDKALIDKTAKEGDVLSYENGIYKADKNATAKRRKEISEMMKKINM